LAQKIHQPAYLTFPKNCVIINYKGEKKRNKPLTKETTMKTQFKLDYTIVGTENRIAYLNQFNLPQLSPKLLELCADYVLHEDSNPNINKESKFNNQLQSKFTELTEEVTPKQAKYTNPKQEIDYAHPSLAAIKEAKETLSDKIDRLQSDEPSIETSKQLYLLRKWKLELSLDAGLIWKFVKPTIVAKNTVLQFHQIDIENEMYGLDWSNPFHIKQVVRWYAKLRQSDQSVDSMWYFEFLVDNAPLKSWQRHLLIRKLDGADQITIGCELNTLFNKTIKPSYLSQALRPIYRIIADFAEVHRLQIELAKCPNSWQLCQKCKQKKLKHRYYFYNSSKTCKICTKRQKEEKDGL